MTTRPIELSLQAINTRLERSATAAQQRTVAPQPTRFDGVTGGFSGAVPRFRPLGSDGGVLGLPQASGALGVGAPVGFVAGLGSATPRLGDPGLGGAVLSPEAIRASVLAQTGWQVGDGTPTAEGIVARYPYDVYYSRDLGAGYYWNPSTSSTQGSWIAFFQQHGAAGAPAIDSVVSGGTAVNETNGDLYAGDGTGSSGWTLVTGGGGGGGCCCYMLKYTYDPDGAGLQTFRTTACSRPITVSVTETSAPYDEYGSWEWWISVTQTDTGFEPPETTSGNEYGSTDGTSAYTGEGRITNVTATIQSISSPNDRIAVVVSYRNMGISTSSGFTIGPRSDTRFDSVDSINFSGGDLIPGLSTPGEYLVRFNSTWPDGAARIVAEYTVSSYVPPVATATQMDV